jgi:hypothetical protein
MAGHVFSLSWVCLPQAVLEEGMWRHGLAFNAFTDDWLLKVRSLARADSSTRHKFTACCKVGKGVKLSNCLRDSLSLTPAMTRVAIRSSEQCAQRSAVPASLFSRIKNSSKVSLAVCDILQRQYDRAPRFALGEYDWRWRPRFQMAKRCCWA